VLGTWINVAAIVIGGLVGGLLGDRLPERTRETVLSGLGLMTMVVGLQMALATRNVLIVLVSVLVGAVLGEWWGIEARLERTGKRLEARVASARSPAPGVSGGPGTRSLSCAFVTASLVFCVGPIAIIGPIRDGMAGDHSLLVIKSVLDGFASLAFGAALGSGVAVSALSVLVYQGAISVAAMALAGSLGQVTRESPPVVEMTATGGVLIMGISLMLLNLRQVRVGNMLPAVAIAPLVVLALRLMGTRI
jgi:uncharacterized protein